MYNLAEITRGDTEFLDKTDTEGVSNSDFRGGRNDTTWGLDGKHLLAVAVFNKSSFCYK